MGSMNECSPELEGRRAAVDLANTRREDFTNKCWSIDNKLGETNPMYAARFMRAMNQELEERNLLPRVELNLVATNDADAMRTLQNKKYVETRDLVRTEDDMKDRGRYVEAMLVHGLIRHEKEIHDSHADRNVWGKNHGGINHKRLEEWSKDRPADDYGAYRDTHPRASRPYQTQPYSEVTTDSKPCPPEQNKNHRNDVQPKEEARPSEWDKQQDQKYQQLEQELAKERKTRETLEKAAQMRAKVEAGVDKDAHHTIKHGETLYDMACLSLHKTGRVHLTPGAIKFEIEKIRALNHLGPHEPLHTGQSIMLRTPQEVDREVARRIKLNEQAASAGTTERSTSTEKTNASRRHDEDEPVRNENPWGRNSRRRAGSNESPIPQPESTQSAPGYANSTSYYAKGY